MAYDEGYLYFCNFLRCAGQHSMTALYEIEKVTLHTSGQSPGASAVLSFTEFI
jgi:hypothetical protein